MFVYPQVKETAAYPKISRMSNDEDHVTVNIINKKNTEYSAFYKSDDGVEVKKVFPILRDL